MIRWIAPAVFFLCAAWYFRQAIEQIDGINDAPSDFRWYHSAAREVAGGRSPFVSPGYIYPPLLAFLLTPLAPLDYVTARRAWFFFSHACLLAAAWVLWRAMGRGWPAAGWIAVVWALGGAAGESIDLGQPGPQLTLLLTLAYTQRGWRQSLAAGIGLALKFIPGIVGIAFLMRRERSAILVWLGSSAVLLALPWMVVLCCLAGPTLPSGADAWSGTPAILSWSLPSAALRAMDPPARGLPLPRNWEVGNDLATLRLSDRDRIVSIAVAVVTLGAGMATLIRNTPLVMPALLALGLAASPVAWTHYQVLQYPGIALLLDCLWKRRAWVKLASALSCAALLYPIPVEVLRAYYQAHGGWTAASPATLYLWTSVTPVASLAVSWLLNRAALLTNSNTDLNSR